MNWQLKREQFQKGEKENQANTMLDMGLWVILCFFSLGKAALRHWVAWRPEYNEDKGFDYPKVELHLEEAAGAKTPECGTLV